MKKFLSIVLFLTLGIGATFAQKAQMQKAVMDVYNRIIAQNPNDYEALMNRAHEYYKLNEYMRALKDVDQALRLIPEKDTDLRLQAYMLQANINTQTGANLQALQALNSALALDPNYFVALYQRANIQYSLGNYSEARADYQRLERRNPRSAEILIGLARVAVKENNLGAASEYLERAVDADPGNPDVYVRRASVRRQMGNDRGAVDDLIVALSTDQRNARASRDLIALSNDNYPVVIEGLTSAMNTAPNVAMLPYLRAFIAQAHYHYTAALADYQHILNDNLYNYHGLHLAIAQCQYALGHYQEALASIDRALEMDRNQAEAFITRSQILRALGQYDQAKTAAAQAIAVKNDDIEALDQMGLCYMSLKEYGEAAGLFGEATLSQQRPMPYLLRAWVLGSYLNQPEAASGFYEQVADMAAPTDNSMATLRGFGLLFAGHKEQAVQWAESALAAAPDKDGYANYLAACLFAAADMDDRALQCVEASLEHGYADYHNWTENNDARINVATLRDDLRFLQLMHKYAHIFGR